MSGGGSPREACRRRGTYRSQLDGHDAEPSPRAQSRNTPSTVMRSPSKGQSCAQPSSTSPARSASANAPTPSSTQPPTPSFASSLACVCGSDLWYYRGETPSSRGTDRPRVRRRRRGRRLRGSNAREGRLRDRALRLQRRHVRALPHGITPHATTAASSPTTVDGGQGEAVRVPFADGTLVPSRAGHADESCASLLTLSDVMGTGHHAAVCAGVRPATRSQSSATARSVCARSRRQAARRRAHHRPQPPRRPAAARPRVRRHRHRRAARRRGVAGRAAN